MAHACWAYLSGVCGGIFGGTCGIGSGVFNIPILTTFFRVSQHQAHGTCAGATVLTGLFGSTSFFLSSGSHSVDLPAAAIITASAMVSAPLSARYAQKISGKRLLYLLTGMLVSTVPVVLLSSRDTPVNRRDIDDIAPIIPLTSHAQGMAPVPEVLSFTQEMEVIPNQVLPKVSETFELLSNKPSWLPSTFLITPVDCALATALGALTGVLSGAFGVGGGFIMVPILSAFTGNHQLALGTSLCAMVGPSMASSFTHWKLGNVARGIAFPLALGSACGAYIGTMAAIVPR